TIREKWLARPNDTSDCAFLSLGTGVGAGLFLDGHLYRSAHFAAGEAGEMSFPTDDSDTPPPRVSDVVGKRSIQKKAKRATGEKMSAAEALTKSQDEPRLERVTDDVVEYLSSLTVAICSLLDPEGIIFGRGTSKACEA